MRDKTMELIKNFIGSVESKYEGILEIGYEYDELSQLHYVWHTNKLLEDEDEGFRRFVGNLILEIYDAGIYNFCFSYDYEREQTLHGVETMKGSSSENLLWSNQEDLLPANLKLKGTSSYESVVCGDYNGEMAA